jgi:tRNA pseudouridine55 synthase
LLNGIISINKPAGPTSHDIVNKLRKILGIKKIGHTGTLDPAATGVLPLCTGKATKLIQYFPTDKQYIAEVTLGIETDSYDAEGKIIFQQATKVDKVTLSDCLKEFEGEITQQVPRFSATHYKGKKLYEYAHKGIEVEELPSKQVKIYKIELIELIKQSEEHPIAKIIIDCGPGTYIRSIAHDLGKRLGCGAHLNRLTRTMSSNITLAESLTIEQVSQTKEDEQLEKIFIPVEKILNLPIVQVGYGQIERITRGQYFRIQEELFHQDTLLLLQDKEKTNVAICKFCKDEQIIKPVTVLI